MKNKTKNLFLLACFMTMALGYAQDVNVEEARTLYPDANAIILSKTADFKITTEDNKIKAVSDIHQQIFINKESGLLYQNESLNTNTFIGVSNINAFTLVPKGSKYEKKKVEKIELKDDQSRSSFYDEEKSYQFIFPSVQTGAILDESYTVEYIDPHFVGSFYFSDYAPFMQADLTVSVQKNIHINYKIFNDKNSIITFTKEEKKNETIYHWSAKRVKSIQQFDDAPDTRYFEPHIILYITDYEINGEKKKLLGTPKDLYAWYTDLLKDVNKKEDAKLKGITDSLVAGVTDELEKVRKIFYWVQDNITYVAFEDGLGGFIPRDASTVCNKKYGDCKDMASIINEMLRMAGIKSYLTWIGSRDIPYSYTDVPTPSVDNHMITSYIDKNKQWHFLDATGKHAPEGLYTSFIQGKQALIGISKDSFQLVTVPIKDTSVNKTIDYDTLEIKDNMVMGRGSVSMVGYDALHYTYRTETMSKDEKQDYFKAYFLKGSNKINYTDLNASSQERGTLNFSYKFNLPDYVSSYQNEMYINLNISKGLGLEAINKTREIPMDFTNKTMHRDITVLKIPDAYKVDYIPENVAFGNEVAGFSCHYEVRGDEVILTSDFYINTLLLDVKDFEKFNGVLKEQVKANKNNITLIKK